MKNKNKSLTESNQINYTGTTQSQIKELGASTRFKGSKTIYMQLKIDKEKN